MNLLLTILVFFSPHGGCTAEIVRELAKAKRQVLVQAYSFTSEPIAQALIAGKQRGADVQVILDKNWPTGAPKVEAELVAAGVPLLSDAQHAIAHNKVIVIDGATVITGSFNFTNQAELMNAENLLVIRSAKTAALYAANWNAHAAHSHPPVPPSPSPSPQPTP
jgi:phosphatidylserine/phosphatidylglycerophosphate/cardiolipin synthase-like enzyme